MLFDSETVKVAGKRSGEGRRRKAREQLTADRVLEEFGQLETVGDVAADLGLDRGIASGALH